LLLACPLLLSAQKNITKQQLIWYSFFNTLQFNEQWSLQTDVQERHYINPTAQHQLVMRTALHRALPQGWDVSAGMCLFLQDPNDPEAVIRLRVPELRPHLQVAHRKQYKHLTVIHRYRTEARFFHNVSDDKTELADGYDFGNFRFRYQLQLQIPLWKISEKSSLKLRVNDELMVNAGRNITRNVFDQNRIYAALAMDITPEYGVEIGYMKWFQQRSSGVDFFDRNILRFSFHHRFRFNKKDKGES
jgi:hypothetical protein